MTTTPADLITRLHATGDSIWHDTCLEAAATLAQMQAEIAELRAELDDALKNNLHEYLVSEKHAERAESNLSAAKELLREARQEIVEASMYRDWEPDDICASIDAFLQDKP